MVFNQFFDKMLQYDPIRTNKLRSQRISEKEERCHQVKTTSKDQRTCHTDYALVRRYVRYLAENMLHIPAPSDIPTWAPVDTWSRFVLRTLIDKENVRKTLRQITSLDPWQSAGWVQPIHNLTQ